LQPHAPRPGAAPNWIIPQQWDHDTFDGHVMGSVVRARTARTGNSFRVTESGSVADFSIFGRERQLTSDLHPKGDIPDRPPNSSLSVTNKGVWLFGNPLETEQIILEMRLPVSKLV
jgi:hypothetical protein